MSGKRVIVTVDGKKAAPLEELIPELKRDGLDVEKVDTVLGVTHIVGQYDGELSRLNRKGVVAERERWMTQM